MELMQVAQTLGISAYPEQMNAFAADQRWSCICDPQWIDSLQQTYQVFGKYTPLVRKAALELQKDRVRLDWGLAASGYFAACNVSQARMIPMPESNGSAADDFLPLLILMTQLQKCVKNYTSRGMPEDMIKRNLDHFADGISIVEKRTGRPGIDQTYFNWLCKFIKTTLYNCHGFNFEIREFPGNMIILQNVADASIIPVITEGNVHRSGLILNSAGCEDPGGSFTPVFRETNTFYHGHSCSNGKIDLTPSIFPKESFKEILRPGDPVISVHIPRGTDISANNARRALKMGFMDATLFYPEHQAKALYCHSWLLDPTLGALLSPKAKIPQFGSLFTRYPAKSAGKEVFSFVFNGIKPYNTLPENTSLEKALKNHYQNGNYILAYSGIALPDQM